MTRKRCIQFLLLSVSILALTTLSWLNPSKQSIPVLQITTPVYYQPFYLGILEDSNLIGGNTDVFQSMIVDLSSRGLDTVMFVNNDSERDAPLLSVSDALKFNVFMLPTADLNRNWWPAEVPANLETAIAVADPILNRWKSHPSLKGYVTKDEPGLHELEKVSLINQAFRSLDPSRPILPILIGVDRVGPIFDASQPDVMLIDVYPVGAQNSPCDLTMNGFGYPFLDFVSYIRTVTQNKPASVPLWVILQTHSFPDQLREPMATEVREQHWLAIGEGAKGIFWFIYSSQQGWRGLRDNPELYSEVTALTQRTIPLRDILLGLQKTEDLFTISGTGSYVHYVSTLSSAENKHFIVAVNRDCQNAQDLTIHSPDLKGQLKDLETAAMYDLASPISFLPGDGKIFEFVPSGQVIPTDISTQTGIPSTVTDTPTNTFTATQTSILTETPTDTPTATQMLSYTPMNTPTNTIITPTPIPATPTLSPDALYPLLERLLQALLAQLGKIVSF